MKGHPAPGQMWLIFYGRCGGFSKAPFVAWVENRLVELSLWWEGSDFPYFAYWSTLDGSWSGGPHYSSMLFVWEYGFCVRLEKPRMVAFIHRMHVLIFVSLFLFTLGETGVVGVAIFFLFTLLVCCRVFSFDKRNIWLDDIAYWSSA